MGKFNLLDEKWILVLDKNTGRKTEVSMLEFFNNAENYFSIAGEMETQNFAIMRFLLSVVHTVFSRFDYDGKELPGIELDANYKQKKVIDKDDIYDENGYENKVLSTWKELYNKKDRGFPKIVTDYLEKWRKHFYLFDDDYPFYQINKKELDEIKKNITIKNPTEIYGKNLNRTISESENKTALFSPIFGEPIKCMKKDRSTKDILTSAELVRWLIMFQGYTGLADKAKLKEVSGSFSKGWLFDIGGIFLQGESMCETLIINYIPILKNHIGSIQLPCWERSGKEIVDKLCKYNCINNLAELYTNWSRAIFLDPNSDITKPIKIEVVKLPEIDHSEASIEPMTLWKWELKDKKFVLNKHSSEKALWRSFGIITLDGKVGDGIRRPKLLDQYKLLSDVAENRWTNIVGVSMKDDGNAQSWLPKDEIVDSFRINDLIIIDKDSFWLNRINDVVEKTKDVISDIFKKYLQEIYKIRNNNNNDNNNNNKFINNEIENIYGYIDIEFKYWLSSIEYDDSKEEKVKLWYRNLENIVLKYAEELLENYTTRDLIGIEEDNKVKNIATIYLELVNKVKRKLRGGI